MSGKWPRLTVGGWAKIPALHVRYKILRDANIVVLQMVGQTLGPDPDAVGVFS
jgi:hypothetical protein